MPPPVYRLADELRPLFQRPFGPVLQTAELPNHLAPEDVLVCVGDHVSQTALDLGYEPKLIIVDYKTQRGAVDPELRQTLSRYGKTVLRVANPPATVSKELYAAVVQAFRLSGSVRIEVEGEEDLAGLPVFAEAPLGTVVLYGMPHRGIVLVRLDEAFRRQAQVLLRRMREPGA